jgi:NAD(P)H-hydrate epimerase
MARLLGVTVSDIQSNRIEVTRKAAKEWHKTVVLKGAYTVIAGAEGKVMVCPVVNPGLATAGTGDVLAGVIAGLLAQGLTFFEAAVAGAFVHGKAGDVVAVEFGDTGMLASDLLPVLPHIIRQTRESKSKT